jgi:hypothetical protein
LARKPEEVLGFQTERIVEVDSVKSGGDFVKMSF